jgi:hypothetical protein
VEQLSENERLQERIRVFREDLRTLQVGVIVQKYITFGDCYILEQPTYFELKRRVAKQFHIHPSEILVVGSGKLGFSLVESKRYRLFGETSDIDVAIISPLLFERLWHETFEYWRSKAYWPEQKKFKEYFFRGWLRPDKLPPANSFEAGRVCWNSSGLLPMKEFVGLSKSEPLSTTRGIF